MEIPSQSGDGPYRLCAAAAIRLKNYSLRPREWYNLAIIHGPLEFYLHDDFYDESGIADQPQEPVIDANAFPIPSLAEVSGNLEAAIDFALTRWFLRDDVVAVLRQFDAHQLLAAIISRYRRTKNGFFHHRYWEICGRAIGRPAESFIREILGRVTARDRILIIYAARECLLHEHAMNIAMSALEELPPPERVRHLFALAPFRDPAVLDWIERQLVQPITAHWGDLAACSRIDWARISRWLNLDTGGQLLLVGLDALVACNSPRPGQSIVMRQIAPKLLSHPGYEQMTTILKEIAAKEPTPRVKRAVTYILQYLPVICGEQIAKPT